MDTGNKIEILDNGDDEFLRRHIGPSMADQQEMLNELGFQNIEQLMEATLPENIKTDLPLQLPDPLSEKRTLAKLRALANRIKTTRSLIGTGYYPAITPGVIQRNIFENPAWYTAYTPYQPEISQGRLEALLNFQTMVCDLTGMEMANASLLDEATAAAEAMVFCHKISKSRSDVIFVSSSCHPQIIDVIQTRAEPIGIKVVIGDEKEALLSQAFAVLLQYPSTNGEIHDYFQLTKDFKSYGGMVIVAADLLSLALLKPPGEWGADVVVGSSQRFGVPLGFGGPHAAFFATRDEYKRSIPGRIVGVSQDANGDTALRLALQTREQHIRREKATSNICTAQVLLAVLASMYAVYHGPDGIRAIAKRVHTLTKIFAEGVKQLGYSLETDAFFDTIIVKTEDWTHSVLEAARVEEINLRSFDDKVGISLDETCDMELIERLWSLMSFDNANQPSFDSIQATGIRDALPSGLERTTEFLTHPVFNSYHSETEMLRYIRRLSDKDIALDRSMIPLGSCTMKLNATSEMIPISWPEFSQIHPFAPKEQLQGYESLLSEIESMLADLTGYSAISLQPNAGSQGEFAGLLAIDAFHRNNNDHERNICLIPQSAHGTNPASAQMVGLKVIPV